MASTSFSTCVPRYDVFLSFRGKDTRYSFTDHLYDAFMRAGVRTFRDNEEIDRGQELKPEIERAIIESRAFIVVLSENYANSRWCLDELCLILEQKRECNHFVFPVFYHVTPSDVRNQRQSFTIEGPNWTEYNVNRWKAALAEIADLRGFVVSGPETNCITEIIDIIDCKLDLKLTSTPSHLIGIETRAKGINPWLLNEQSEFLAICGMAGSGKTTLAQYIYNLNKQNFERSSFLLEIRKHRQQPLGLLGLQKQLLRDLSGGKSIKISSVSEVTSKIEEAIYMKRVLIVLDEIDEHDDLVALLGTKKFHAQSKVIITTGLLELHTWFGSISWRCKMYKLKLLNDNESLELLSFHAFGSKIPMKGFEELAVKLTNYCEGNPLALKVLGSSLFVGVEDSQKIISSIEIWISKMNSLNGDLDHKIEGVLRRSFDSLPHDSHRKLFMFIACLFVGQDEDNVVRMFGHDRRVKAGIMILINRGFLAISPSKKLMMHELIQEMGRKIAREESSNLAECSRFWEDHESYHVWEKGEGSKTIEGPRHDKEEAKVSGSFGKQEVLKLNRSASYMVSQESNVTINKSIMTSAQACRNFSFEEIQSATRDFNDELVIGRGGYGKVYKGEIRSEENVHVVAIKRWDSMSHQGAPEFRAEIEVLSKVRHCNLVSLIGYCDDKNELILVYEYIPNGNLYNHLRKALIPLSWVQRLKIAVGVGRGLDYLHTGVGSQYGIIHRDVKSSNILLDDNLTAMVTDFGMSAFCPTFDRSSSHIKDIVKGTMGYLDPECFHTGIVTRKSDVFAFGVVLFELLSGKGAMDRSLRELDFSLLTWARDRVQKHLLDQIVDSNIRGTISSKCLRRFTQIAIRCSRNVSKERPTMAQVVVSLEDILELQEKYDDSALIKNKKIKKL